MTATFEDIQARAREIEGSYAERNAMYTDLEDMYLLEGTEDLPDEDWIKDTISPDPRNALAGAVRLLVASDPTFSVPTNTNNPQIKRNSSKIEKFCAASYQAMCNLAGEPIHYDAALSGLLYGEVDIEITLTQDMVARAKTPAQKAQAEAAAALTPFMLEVINPNLCYPVYGRLGLREYLTVRETTVGDIRERWGDDVVPGKKVADIVTYYDYFDLAIHAAWIQGEKDPLLNEPHNLPYIPVVSAITEGSRLFYRSGQQTRQPLLYTDWKTGLWKRKNLALTLLYSLSFSIGANPVYIWRRNDPNKAAPERDYSTPGGLLILDQGEDYQALAKQVIDPSFMTGLEIGERKGEESTIYKQTLGEPLGANAPFSMVALLSQSGRLPLTSYQRMLSFALGKAMYCGLMLSKEYSGSKLTAMGNDGLSELTGTDIPERFNLEAKLDISMPQDDRQMVAVAMQATQGDNPLVSKREARERWLKIGQSDDMDREILEEQYTMAMAQLQLQAKVQQYMQQMQPQQPAPQPQMQMPARGPQQMPPDLAAQMQGQLQSTGAEPGLPGMPAGAPMEPGAPGGPAMPGEGGMMGGMNGPERSGY